MKLVEEERFPTVCYIYEGNQKIAITSKEAYQILSEKINTLVEALEKIERWFGEFPKTGQFHDDGTEMSYSYCYGSNGQRDYMRQVARDALIEFMKNDGWNKFI